MLTNPLIAYSHFFFSLEKKKVTPEFDHEKYRIRNKIPCASLKVLTEKRLRQVRELFHHNPLKCAEPQLPVILPDNYMQRPGYQNT